MSVTALSQLIVAMVALVTSVTLTSTPATAQATFIKTPDIVTQVPLPEAGVGTLVWRAGRCLRSETCRRSTVARVENTARKAGNRVRQAGEHISRAIELAVDVSAFAVDQVAESWRHIAERSCAATLKPLELILVRDDEVYFRNSRPRSPPPPTRRDTQ